MIRTAKYKEAEVIQNLILRYTENGQVLYRPLEDIQNRIEEFIVCEQGGKLVGVCHLKTGWRPLAEIRSLVIDPGFQRRGIGTALVKACIERAEADGMKIAFVLTYAVPLFEKLGFKVVDKSTLPMKVWNDCAGCMHQERCDETAMVLPLVKQETGTPQPLAESTE